MSAIGAAVSFSALNCATPNQGVPVTSREDRDCFLVDEKGLRVVPGSVGVALWMKELEATGPVLKAGPMAAFAVEKAVAARE